MSNQVPFSYENILEGFKRMQDSFMLDHNNENYLHYSNWIQAGETEQVSGLTNLNYEELFDLTSTVIQCIPEYLQAEQEISIFMNAFSNITSDIITYTTSGIVWNVNLMDKFVWIAIMLSIKINHKIIPYFIKLVTDKEYILRHEDNFGNNSFSLASWNISALIELIHIFSKGSLSIATSSKITPMDILAYNGGIISLIESKELSIDEALSYMNEEYGTNVLHISSTLVNQTDVFEYFLASGAITKDIMRKKDKNNNIPLLISCKYGSVKHIELILQHKLYDENMMGMTNINGHSVLTYAASGNLLKYFMDFITEAMWFDLKLYDHINNDDMFQMFIKSKLFTYETLTKEYQSNIGTPTNLIRHILFKKAQFIEYILNSSDEKIIDITKNIFTNHKYLLSYVFDKNIKLSLIILKSKYMEKDLLTELYNGSTFIQRIIHTDLNNNNNNANIDNMKELLNLIFDSQSITVGMITNDLINYCAKNFCELVTKLINRGFVDNIISLIYCMLDANNIYAIKTLLSMEGININYLKNNKELLKRLIDIDSDILSILLGYEVLNDDLTSLFVLKGIINLNVVQYSIPDNILGKLFSKFKVEELNVFEFDKNSLNINSESILNNIKTHRQLKILLETCPDFDNTLFFRKGNLGFNFFITQCLTGNVKTVEYLMNHKLFDKDEYEYLTNEKIRMQRNYIFCKQNETIIERIVEHRFFSDKIINMRFEFDDNLLQHLIICRIDEKILSIVLNNQAMNTSFLDHRNTYGNNCLIVALEEGICVSLILNSKYFNFDMMMIKNHSNVSAEDLLYDHLDYNFLQMYCILFPKSDLLYRQFKQNNTIVHKLITKEGLPILLELISLSEVDILLKQNCDGNSPLHYITLKKYYYDELRLLLEIKELSFKKEHFYMTNNSGMTPLGNIITLTDNETVPVLEKLINMKVIEEKDLSYVTSEKITLCEYIIERNVALFDILFQYNFNLEKSLEKLDENCEPLYFKLIRTQQISLDKRYAKFINQKVLNLANSQSNTLLFEIITTDHRLSNQLISDKIIDVQMLIPYLSKFVSRHPNTIKFLLDALPKLFTKENLLYCISQCIELNLDALELLLKSKYCTKEIFLEIYLKPELLIPLLESPNSLKYMFENNLITSDILGKNNGKMMFEIDDPIYLKYIANIIFDNSDNNLCKIIYNGKTIFHKCANYPNLIEYYINEYLKFHDKNTNDSELILLQPDNYKKTFLDYLLENSYIHDINGTIEIIKKRNERLLYKLLLNQDNNNRNFVMKCCMFEKLNPILSNIKQYINSEILKQFDINGTTSLMYLIRYINFNMINMVNMVNIVNMINIVDMVNYEDKYDHDIFSTATRYNHKNLEVLLNNKEYKEYVEAYKNFDKCFIIACRYQPYAIKLLLETGKINPKKCNGLIQYDDYFCHANFLQIACRYNEESVRELVTSKLNLQEYIDNIRFYDSTYKGGKDVLISFNAFKLALLYEPDALTTLLDSKYGNSKMISDANSLCKDNNCIVEAIEKQLASYIRIVSSKYYNASDIILNNQYYGMIPQHETLQKLLKHKDIPCDENNIHVCSTCYSNINRIIFAPCGHRSCVMCSTRLHECPQCRTHIEHRMIFN